jgi:hypothetical protein
VGNPFVRLVATASILCRTSALAAPTHVKPQSDEMAADHPPDFTTIKHIAHNLIRKASGEVSMSRKHKVAASTPHNTFPQFLWRPGLAFL